jgi:hypothetical protein
VGFVTSEIPNYVQNVKVPTGASHKTLSLQNGCQDLIHKRRAQTRQATRAIRTDAIQYSADGDTIRYTISKRLTHKYFQTHKTPTNTAIRDINACFKIRDINACFAISDINACLTISDITVCFTISDINACFKIRDINACFAISNINPCFTISDIMHILQLTISIHVLQLAISIHFLKLAISMLTN